VETVDGGRVAEPCDELIDVVWVRQAITIGPTWGDRSVAGAKRAQRFRFGVFLAVFWVRPNECPLQALDIPKPAKIRLPSSETLTRSSPASSMG
jgi:hypothetical protein